MNARFWQVAAALSLLASFTGCSSKEPSSPASPPPSIHVTASKSMVVANGTNSVTLTVTDSGGGPISLTTNRGTFSTGGTSATIPGSSGTLGLVSCDAATLGCVGTATVTASSTTGTATASVTFSSLASLCAGNCAADAGCPNLACNLAAGGTGACSSTSPSTCVALPCTPNPPGATTETSCIDGIDNNCDGKTDGADAACEGQPCKAGSPTFLWKAGACTDISSGLGIKVTPARTRLPADGTATTTIVVELTAGTDPLPATSLSISTTLGTIAPQTAATDSKGKAAFTFTSSATPGTATVTAYVSSVPSITQSVTITMPRLGSLALPTNPGAVEHPVQGAKGSGWNDFGWVQVQALDDTGLPYPDGLKVHFEHRPLGGSALADPLAVATTTGCTVSPCIGYDAVVSSGGGTPDSTGLASTTLYSGTVAGTLAVTATATIAGVTRTVTLPTVTVVGAKASGANFSIVCNPRNVPALAETDCSISLVDAPFTCEALLKDRFDNVLGTATQVIFVSEAGSVGQVTTTPAYDPTSTGAQDDLGVAVQTFNTLGAGLPFDVDPQMVGTTTVEPFVVHGLDGCGVRTHNPRDGVVTIIAIADGEEAFFDVNGNGSYDPAGATSAEPFIDQGEPFVDQNDNGQWDPGEWFLDVNGNGVYDGPNGIWDASTKIWTQTVVVFSGEEATLVTGGRLVGTRIAGDDFVDPCIATSVAAAFDVLDATTTTAGLRSQSYALVASDMNLNWLDAGTHYGITTFPSDAPIKLAYFGLDQYADQLGLFYRYWPCDQAGSCASQCRGTGARCVMNPSVGNYSCGVTTSMTVTGGDKAGSGTVRWNVDVPWTVYDGVNRVSHGGDSVSGIVR